MSVLAAIAAVGESAPATTPVVVTAVDLPAGSSIVEQDLAVVDFPVALAPPGAFAAPGMLTGAVVTTSIAAGEALTATRLLGDRPDAGQGRVAAPVRLADAGIAGLLAPGDVVDVLASSPRGDARVVCRGARVITRPLPPAAFGTQTGSLVVLAVTRAEAVALAGVATTGVLSVVLQ